VQEGESLATPKEIISKGKKKRGRRIRPYLPTTGVGTRSKKTQRKKVRGKRGKSLVKVGGEGVYGGWGGGRGGGGVRGGGGGGGKKT